MIRTLYPKGQGLTRLFALLFTMIVVGCGSSQKQYVFTGDVAAPKVAPTIVFTTPTNGAIGVPTNQKVAVAFNQAMDPNTLNSTSFQLKGPGNTVVPGSVNLVDRVATFTPTNLLVPNALYTATIDSQVTSVAGLPLATSYSWSFTTGTSPDTTAPTVTFTDPASNQAGVSINQKIAVTFSKSMDPTTITASQFTLRMPGGAVVPGSVSSLGLVTTFTPTDALTPNTLYSATIDGQAADLTGNTLVGDYSWSFTTGVAPDTTAPTVTSTDPADSAVNVASNSDVSATFSEPMKPATITNLTFTLAGPGSVTVPATVTYDAINRVAILNPTTDLEPNTTYVATIKTSVSDLAGNTLISDYTWSFTTEVITLGAAAPFGSFGGGAGMTNQGLLTVVHGDIGTTGAATLITGFHDSTGESFTETPLNQGEVTGIIFTASTPPGGESRAAEGGLAAQKAYDDLKDLPGGTVLASDQLGGLTLAPGIYKTATSYQITGSDLTLDGGGDPNAIWIFQVGSSLTVGAPALPRSVILTNGAQAQNVYWQVGSAATINAAGGGTMVGTIIAQAGVVFSTAGNVDVVTLNGRALGLNASVTLVNTIINIP